MASLLGKRKIDALVQKAVRQESDSKADRPPAEDDMNPLAEVFRRHFEQRFRPLAGGTRDTKAPPKHIEAASEQESEDEWSGISEDEVEVVEHSGSTPNGSDLLNKSELKAFMSSKPPSATAKPKPALTDPDSASDDDAANLKNDLALQRLLSESHLLHQHSSNNLTDTSTGPADPLRATGATRHRALDLRLQALGAKGSLYERKKGLKRQREEATRAQKVEEDRRREAREAGIVLEKVGRKKRGTGRRERGVGGPSVGMLKRGMLVLSKRDVADIEGIRGGSGRGRGKASRRGRR